MENTIPRTDDPAHHEAAAALRSGTSPPAPPQTQREQELADTALALFNTTRPRRTLGLHIFDWTVYSLNNFLVFGVSVAATYLAMVGKDAQGQARHGKIGQIFNSATDKTVKTFERWGMKPKSAKDAAMVGFSFAYGSVFAVMVKLLENKREEIAKWIDERFGSKHPDETVYQAEPHQTWSSVALGRVLTFGIVVPTAMVLSNIKFKGQSLNEHAFYNNGERLGNSLQKIPLIAKLFGKLDIKTLSRVSIFELFYTSVCTVGLFFTSRFIARTWENQEKRQDLIQDLQEFKRETSPNDIASPNAALPTPTLTSPLSPAPSATISVHQSHGRIHHHTPELTPTN